MPGTNKYIICLHLAEKFTRLQIYQKINCGKYCPNCTNNYAESLLSAIVIASFVKGFPRNISTPC